MDFGKAKEKLPPFVYVDNPKTGGVLRYSFGAPEVLAFTKEAVLSKAGGVKACANAQWLNDIEGFDRVGVAVMTAGFTKGWKCPEANPSNYDHDTGNYRAPTRSSMLQQRREASKDHVYGR